METPVAKLPSTSDQGITVRKALPTDAVDIAKLGAQIFTVTFGYSVPPHELQAYLEEAYSASAITSDLSNAQKDTIVATDQEGQILGFAVLARGTIEPCVEDLEGKVELQRIYVDNNVHGKGIGRLLAETIDSMARQQGFRNIWLGVWEENQKAQMVYSRWGYKQVGAHDFAIGSVIQTDHIMTKSLSVTK
jgi:ribosomal protein S18 acetylase RimI-like enzyme